MIIFSDKPNEETKSIRLNIINQLSSQKILLKEDYEDLFGCKIEGLPVPTVQDYIDSTQKLSKEIKKSFIMTSDKSFSTHDVYKIFGDLKGNMSELFEHKPYSYCRDMSFSEIPQDLLDENGVNVYDTLLGGLSLTREDLNDNHPLLFHQIERFTYPGKKIIDTQKMREHIISSFMLENPKVTLYREDMGNIFKTTGCYYYNYETRQLHSRNISRQKIKTDTITQIIQARSNITYEAVGKIFGRTKMQIRDIARDHGIYRYNNGVGRVNESVDGESWSKIKAERKKERDNLER